MIDTKHFYDILFENGIDCFCGVPDSLLKNFCAYVTDHSKNHTICANEGNTVGLACGHYLATKRPALVYMQNSGLGNCVNPILSLLDEDVYKIPALFLIGWRGEPNVKDEPQHIKQGKLTLALLETMGIKYCVLDENYENQLKEAFSYMERECKPFALVVRKNSFDKYNLINKRTNNFEMRREEAIKTILDVIPKDSVIVSTTGFTSRELYEARKEHSHDFLTVGSMGHASSIALGIALEKPEKDIYCFDGDGALLMHYGAVPVIKSKNLKNFKHIIFNNYAHDSVGAQPTVSDMVDFKNLYDITFEAKNKEELERILPKFADLKETALLEIKVNCGAREDLGRPKESPKENKIAFMEMLNG